MRSGRPNRYGGITTTNTCNSIFKLGGKDKTLQIRYYPTKSSIDLSLTGNVANKVEKHMEFGMKNAALFFVDEIMPKFLEYLIQNFDVPGEKEFWANLAKR